MIPYQNWELFISFVFYFGVKIICYTFRMLRQSTLTSIPERNEIEEEPSQKWVPKKKHEVLKAKYKCLKKLFQLYDASVIAGISEPNIEQEDDTRTKRRRRRSHRTKTDACAGTSEISSGDITQSEFNMTYEYDKESIGTEVTRDLKIKQSCSTQIDNSKFINANITNASKYAETNSSESLSIKETHDHPYLPHNPVPYLILNERRKLTRFQCFVQRIFGIRRDTYILPNEAYAASDSVRERQRKRGLRFRRLRRAKKIKSESDIKDIKSPAILSYVQSVQRSCLMDTTPRQCPILGCKMVSYGIINYNDHLNICHFKDRKYICHYCHEGFEKENDKLAHENEHIGLNKLSNNLSNSSTARNKLASNSNTQTDPETAIPEEKLKKIVSFFDKITNQEDIITEIRQNRSSETNLTKNTETNSSYESQNSSEKRAVSCVNIRKAKFESSNSSDMTSLPYGSPVSCHYCGENFNFRRQLSLHVDLEHRTHDKFSKFHSCAGIMDHPRRDLYEAFTPRRDAYGACPGHTPREQCPGIRPRRDLVSEDGRLNVLSINSSRINQTPYSRISSPTPSHETITRGKSEESLSCDPSTNIVYSYTSVGSKKPSVVESLLNRVKSYKWEPGTKIIRV